MFSRHEGFFEGHEGVTLFSQIWEKANARGTVIVTHGQGEHSDCYHRLVDWFKNDSWSFWAWDMRGHGRSEGKRGYVAHFEDYVQDYRRFLRQSLADPRVSGKPVILLSHSMGGLIQLKTLIEDPALRIDGQVCSAPLLGLALPVPKWKDSASTVMNSVYPKITLWNEISNDQLTREPDIIREFEQDVLRHNRISPAVYLGFKESFEYVNPRASQIKSPTLFQLPEQDPVVSTPASKKFFENLGSAHKELKIYGEGARHEMYNDTHRHAVYQDLKNYLDSFLREAR